MIELRNESNEHPLFFYLLVLSLLVAYSPFKAVSLIYPWAFTFLFVLSSRNNAVKNLIRIFIFLFVFTYIGVLYRLLNPDFLFVNYFLFLFTASSFVVLFLDFSHVARKDELMKFVRFLTFFCVFEACVGLFQVLYAVIFVTGSFDVSAGDAAQGTIALQLSSDKRGSNPMFAILQSALMTFIGFLSTGLNKRLPILPLLVIFISWLFASVLHTVFFWSCALLFTALLFPGYNRLLEHQPHFRFLKKKAFTVIIVAVLCSAAILIFLQPRNMLLFKSFAAATFTTDESRSTFKTQATLATIQNLPHEKSFQPLVGLGPGQYSSRAGLIASGEYLSRPILLSPSMGPELDKYILSLWRKFKRLSSSGSTRFPYYSWLSLFGELGLAGVFLVLAFGGFAILKLRRMAMQIPPLLPMGLIFMILYIMALGFQDNYWEFSQPLFIIVLLSKLCYEYSKQEVKGIIQKHRDS